MDYVIDSVGIGLHVGRWLKCHRNFRVVFLSDSQKGNPQWHLWSVHSPCKKLPFAHSFLSHLSVGRSKNLRPLWWLLWEVHSPGSQRPTPSSPLRAMQGPNSWTILKTSPETCNNSDSLDLVVICKCGGGGAFNSDHPTETYPLPKWQLTHTRPYVQSCAVLQGHCLVLHPNG